MSKILPGRTENSIKNYFYSSIRRLKSNSILGLFRDVYVVKSRSLESLKKENDFISGELAKFNVLSRKICNYLLDPDLNNERFTNFLLGVLFNKKLIKGANKRASSK